MAFMVLELGRFGQQIRNSWNVLKCGAGEGYHTEYVLQDTSKVRLSSTLLLPSVCN